MTNNFISGIDRQVWVQVPPAPNAHAAGVAMCSDLRPAAYRHPYIYELATAAVLNRYHTIQKAWNFVQSPGLTGTFGAGAGCAFVPSLGLQGTIASGATTTSITLTTVLPSAVGVNQLANKGNGTGYTIRIIGYTAGKTEERTIIANTSGTTPTIQLSAALTFTPTSSDRYEIISGRVFMLSAGSLAAGMWKSYEIATNTLSGNLSTTNLPATVSTDASFVALDEQYVPYDRNPGEGFIVDTTATYDATVPKKCLVATASSNTTNGTITGQATNGDAVVASNEYRNFQIRIVADATTPASVGQRKIIVSHTAGPSPVYTISGTWTTMPSSSASFVIECPNQILLWSSGATTTYTYNPSGLTLSNGTSMSNDTWSTTYFAARGSAMGAGCTSLPSFGIEPDASRYARHSYIYSFRGGNVATLDLFDIAGAATGSWTSGISYEGGTGVLWTTGACGKYAPCAQNGQYGYANVYVANQISQMYRFDVKNRILQPIAATDWIQTGAAAVGDRVVTYATANGTDTYEVVLLLTCAASNAMELVVQN